MCLYSIVVIITVVLCLITDTAYWLVYFEFYWVLAELIMTSVTLLTWRRIHQSSEALEEMGIHKSAGIIKLYIALWVSALFFSVITIGLNLHLQLEWHGVTLESFSEDLVQQSVKLVIAIDIFLFLTFFNNVCLDLIILVHYWRAGDSVRSQLASSLTKSLGRARCSRETAILSTEEAEEAEER